MSFTKTEAMAMLVIMRTTLGRRPVRRLLLACGPRLGQPPHEDEAPGDVRDALLGVPPLELARRLAHQLPEPAAERAQAREADRVADLGDGEVGGAQQVLGALDPALGDVCRR